MKGKLLLVSGNDDLQIISHKLAKEGYETQETDLQNIFDVLRRYLPFVIIINMEILELKLLEICRILRHHPKFDKISIIILSSFTEEDMEIKCLEVGADFYIQKPVSPTLLISKINAINRRLYSTMETSSQLGNIIIDREKYLVIHNQTPVNLPRKEFELLALLISKTGKVFLRNEILNLIWNNQVDIRTVDVHVCKLRQRFGNDSIKTIKGIGYKI